MKGYKRGVEILIYRLDGAKKRIFTNDTCAIYSLL